MSGLDRDALVSWFSRHSVEDMKKIQDRSVVTGRETREVLHSKVKDLSAARLDSFLSQSREKQVAAFEKLFLEASQYQAAKYSVERLREELAVMTENYEGQKMINKTLVEVA